MTSRFTLAGELPHRISTGVVLVAAAVLALADSEQTVSRNTRCATFRLSPGADLLESPACPYPTLNPRERLTLPAGAAFLTAALAFVTLAHDAQPSPAPLGDAANPATPRHRDSLRIARVAAVRHVPRPVRFSRRIAPELVDLHRAAAASDSVICLHADRVPDGIATIRQL